MKKPAQVAPPPTSWLSAMSLTRLRWLIFWLALACSSGVIQAAGTAAILDFSIPATESNHLSWAVGGMADLLQIELQQQGLVLLDRDAIHAVLNEQRLTASGQTVPDSLALAKLLNAQELVAGKVIPLADGRFRVEASAFSVEAVETVVTAASEGEFPKDMSLVLQSVAKQLAGKLQLSVAPTRGVKRPTTGPKPESLIMFYRGLNACAHGQPDWGVAYFMNAASLDPDFTVSLLWEIKAYEMVGLPQLAAIRREELADILKPLGLVAATTEVAETSNRLAIAVLNPVVSAAGTDDATVLAGDLQRVLLAENRVRVFDYQGIGDAVAEQDLRLGSYFASQNAPRYGRWLSADGLLLCHIIPAEQGHVVLEMSLINPVTASVMARVQQAVAPSKVSERLAETVNALLDAWQKHRQSPEVASIKMAGIPVEASMQGADLRPVYLGLINALIQVQREPEKSDSHRALANALASTGRLRLAAYEIEACLKLLDIHASNADKTYLGTHRWLFWEPSPASSAAGLVDKKLIDQMIQQLLSTYPQSLSAGCLRYNLSVSAWREKNWPEAIKQAQQSRQILQSLIEHYDRTSTRGGVAVNAGDSECEITAATFFLEGESLRESGKTNDAKIIFHQGLDFMTAYKAPNFCLPYGPFIGNFFGPERVYGYGGDSPGIRTRLEHQLAELGEPVSAPPVKAALKLTATSKPMELGSNSIAYQVRQGEAEFKSGRYLEALRWYQQAVAKGEPVLQCPSVAAALLEVALDRNRTHPQDEIERLRRELGFPPVQASWVEWFGAGCQYQTDNRLDVEKAVACYRGALDFLEHPEQEGIYHLQKQPNSDRIALRWGPSLGEVDLLWSENYDRRWYNAAFYLAQCLAQIDQKEEAAQWLRQIAIKLGGDDSVPLLKKDSWNGSAWSDGHLGPRSAELLRELHEDINSPKGPSLGEVDGPFKLPTTDFIPLPLPEFRIEVMQAMTNALTNLVVAKPEVRTARLDALVATWAHDLAPAALWLLLQPDGQGDESTLILILEKTAHNADAPWLAAACVRHLKLIALAQKMDPNLTAAALAQEWHRQERLGSVSFWLKGEIVKARVRPLYALVLQQIADIKANHHSDVFNMERAVQKDKSAELEAAFCQALSTCLKSKLRRQESYELERISQIALRHHVPEAVDALAAYDATSPAKLRAELGSMVDLPDDDTQICTFLKTNQFHWRWRADRNKFEPTFDESL